MYLQNRRMRITLAVFMIFFAVVAGAMLVWLAFVEQPPIALNLATGAVFTLAIVGLIWLLLDPDSTAARQSDEVLQLSSQMLDAAKDGLTFEAAQKICDLLLPATPAIAVAITDRSQVLGYAGYNSENNQPGRPIRTSATKETLNDGKPRILHDTGDIGLPMSSARINAAIVEPLYIGRSIEGTLKFYYRRGNQISRTQASIAQGFAEVLSTQMAASALEEQKKLTTSMELKALQAQINPHFLFNTINTIASLIRTDPMKARVLLRDFAVFYRSTLEDADDLIELSRELRQVERYVSFEVARFGEERLRLVVDVPESMNDLSVPSFMIQPLVENAVKHAMSAEGQLTIGIEGSMDGERIILKVTDDGVGMSEETVANMMDKPSDTGLGIAVKNVRDRIRGYFGPESSMVVTSEVGVGTVVTFTLDRAIAEGEEEGYVEADVLQESIIPEIPQPLID